MLTKKSLGAVAPVFAALAARYASTRFGAVSSDRFVALIGDAELDEGNVWETVAEEAIQGLGNVIWIIDLNRQSLDRVIPGVRAARLKALFAGAGWKVFEAKYGSRLEAAMHSPGGEALRRRIDEMSNEEYQALIRLRDGAELRQRLADVPFPPGSLVVKVRRGQDIVVPGGNTVLQVDDVLFVLADLDQARAIERVLQPDGAR